MKFRTVITIIGLTAIGGFLYLHNRRGGELTLDSMADTARNLFGRVKTEAAKLKERGEQLKERGEQKVMHDVASKVSEATEPH